MSMLIDRWEPFRDVMSARDALAHLFNDSYGVRSASTPGSTVGQLSLDVRESADEFVIEANAPGVKPDDVKITIHGDTLTIRTEAKPVVTEETKGNWLVRERRSGAFQRSLTLNAPINSDAAKASFDHGVLTLVLPKMEAAKPKHIKVQANG